MSRIERIWRQFNHAMANSALLKTLSTVLKVGITLAAIAFIYYRLQGEPEATWEAVLHPDSQQWLFMAIAFMLIPVNLGFEAIKWRLMVSRFYPELSLNRAFQAILAGISAGIFTPNGMGAYAGRVFLLPSGRRTEAALLTFLDRICLMYITLLAGLFSFEYLLDQESLTMGQLLPAAGQGLIFVRIGLWVLIALGAFLALFPEFVSQFLLAHSKEGSLRHRLALAVDSLQSSKLLKVLALSMARYLTFSFQYYFLMLAFGYHGSTGLAIVLVWLVFFVKSIIPSISLTELGIRESVALAVMGAFAIPALTAVSSTFLLYIFNLVIPALIGLFFVQKLSLN